MACGGLAHCYTEYMSRTFQAADLLSHRVESARGGHKTVPRSGYRPRPKMWGDHLGLVGEDGPTIEGWLRRGHGCWSYRFQWQRFALDVTFLI